MVLCLTVAICSAPTFAPTKVVAPTDVAQALSPGQLGYNRTGICAVFAETVLAAFFLPVIVE